ncbi:hypothetical protein F8388_025254, partial [Cannabis sativa]
DSKKTQHLLLLDGAKERLHLFEADLLKEGSFDSVVDGCECVELIDPAVKGTLNVLRSCVKVPSLKRIVFTSSMSAVSFNGRPLTPDVMIDETWFSDPILSEEAAWKFAEENGIDLVSINPGCEDDKPFPPLYQISKEKARNLGIEFTSLEVILRDTIESLKDKGFLNI